MFISGDNLIHSLLETNKEVLTKDEVISMVRGLQVSNKPIIESGPIRIDPNTKSFYFNGSKIKIPNLTFKLLYYFILNKNITIPKDVIIHDIWGDEIIVEYGSLNVQITKIRNMIGRDRIINNKRIGYQYVEK